MTVFMCAFPFRSQGAVYGNTSAFDYFFFVWNRLELICSNVNKYMDGGKKAAKWDFCCFFLDSF